MPSSAENARILAERIKAVQGDVGSRRSISGHGGKSLPPQAALPKITFTRIGLLAAHPKPMAWTIKGVLPQNALAALIGAPKCGKSFLALDMALHVAAGRPWNGHAVTQGVVVYLAGEGHANLSRRVVAAAQRYGINLDDVPLYVSSCAALIDQIPDIESVLMAARDIATTCGLPIRMFVIDTLARSFSGKSENDSSDMGKFVRGMDSLREAYGATVKVVHHSGLAEGAEMRARGSSALLGALDVSMSLVEAKDGIRTLYMTDAKDFEEAAPMGFRLESFPLPAAWNDEDGNSSTSAVMVPTEINADAPAMSDKQRQAHELAGELCGDETRCEKKDLARALQERGIVKDRFAASRLITAIVDRGSLLADGKWVIHPDCTTKAFEANYAA